MKKIGAWCAAVVSSALQASEQISQEIAQELHEVGHEASQAMHEASSEVVSLKAKIVNFFNGMPMLHKVIAGIVLVLLIIWLLKKLTCCKSCSCGCMDQDTCNCHPK